MSKVYGQDAGGGARAPHGTGDLIRSWPTKTPPSPGSVSDACVEHIGLGTSLCSTGKLSEADAEYRTAMAIYQKLADDNPAVTDFRIGLMVSPWTSRSAPVATTGKPAEAEAEFRAALAIQQKLADDNPAATDGSAVSGSDHAKYRRSCCCRWASRGGGGRVPQGRWRSSEKLADDNPAVTILPRSPRACPQLPRRRGPLDRPGGRGQGAATIGQSP